MSRLEQEWGLKIAFSEKSFQLLPPQKKGQGVVLYGDLYLTISPLKKVSSLIMDLQSGFKEVLQGAKRVQIAIYKDGYLGNRYFAMDFPDDVQVSDVARYSAGLVLDVPFTITITDIEPEDAFAYIQQTIKDVWER